MSFVQLHPEENAKKNGASVFRGSFHIFSIFPKPCPSPGDPLARFTGRSQSCGSSSARTRKLRASVEPSRVAGVGRSDGCAKRGIYCIYMYVCMYVCMYVRIYIYIYVYDTYEKEPKKTCHVYRIALVSQYHYCDIMSI